MLQAKSDSTTLRQQHVLSLGKKPKQTHLFARGHEDTKQRSELGSESARSASTWGFSNQADFGHVAA